MATLVHPIAVRCTQQRRQSGLINDQLRRNSQCACLPFAAHCSVFACPSATRSDIRRKEEGKRKEGSALAEVDREISQWPSGPHVDPMRELGKGGNGEWIH
jgi:hypothetical protein